MEYQIYECISDTFQAVELETGMPARLTRGMSIAVDRNEIFPDSGKQPKEILELRKTQPGTNKDGKNVLQITGIRYLLSREIFRKCFRLSTKWQNGSSKGAKHPSVP